MLKNPFDVSFQHLPNTLAIFPIDNLILFPGGQTPLHVFEPKYINLIQDTLAVKDRLMGLCMPKNSYINKEKLLHPVGCAGRVTSFEETPDGRFIITVTGYCRFRIKDEITSMRGYRKFSVDWDEFQSDLNILPNPEIERELLIDKLKEYSKILQIEMDWSVLTQMPSFNIVTFFAMTLPLSSESKQKLLETITIEDRTSLLIDIIEQEIS